MEIEFSEDLEKFYEEKFKELIGIKKRNSNEKLIRIITKTVIKEHSDFIPSEIAQLFRNIQKKEIATT